MRKGFKQAKIQSKSEAIKQHGKLHAKYKEYSIKTTDELTEMVNHLGGGYREVCLHILKERYIENLKANQSEELPDGEIQ